MKRVYLSLFCLVGILSITLIVSIQGCKSGESTYAGVRDDVHGFVIVGSYNSNHDALLEGYHILNIAFVNNSPKAVRLDAAKDVWMIYDPQGRSYKAINSLENENPRVWYAIPFEAQTVLAYPTVVLMNETVSFGLFFHKSVNISDFQRLTFYSASLDSEINGSKVNDISSE
jgi:hypothetical protein